MVGPSSNNGISSDFIYHDPDLSPAHLWMITVRQNIPLSKLPPTDGATVWPFTSMSSDMNSERL